LGGGVHLGLELVEDCAVGCEGEGVLPPGEGLPEAPTLSETAALFLQPLAVNPLELLLLLNWLTLQFRSLGQVVARQTLPPSKRERERGGGGGWGVVVVLLLLLLLLHDVVVVAAALGAVLCECYFFCSRPPKRKNEGRQRLDSHHDASPHRECQASTSCSTRMYLSMETLSGLTLSTDKPTTGRRRR